MTTRKIAKKRNLRAGWDAAMRQAVAKHSAALSQEDIDWLNMPGTLEADYPAYLRRFGKILKGNSRDIAAAINKLVGNKRVSVLLISLGKAGE